MYILKKKQKNSKMYKIFTSSNMFFVYNELAINIEFKYNINRSITVVTNLLNDEPRVSSKSNSKSMMYNEFPDFFLHLVI